jgi:pimeloyl-ACP methyl ester carboxylesterase
MVALPGAFRGIAPDQRGYGEADPEKFIDATRGMGDFVEDILALIDFLDLGTVHFVGNSMGGSVLWELLAYDPERVRSAVFVAPGSPYGFGGTKDLQGTPCYPDFAGSGGGLANQELIQRLKAGDRSTDSLASPRVVLRTLIVKPSFIPPREEELLSGMLQMHIGPKANPGEAATSPNWPFVAPGEWGSANALSPKYRVNTEKLIRSEPKAELLWIRGENDLLVSDRAASDPAMLGMMGLLPGWPGIDIYPPQPMISQTRFILDQYSQQGGRFEEVVIPNTGHVPYIEAPEEFNQPFHNHLQKVENR